MAEIQGKVEKYEHFLNDVLRTNLRVTLERRDQLYTEIAEYMELQRTVKNICPNSDTTGAADKKKVSIRTRVDIGCNFYVQAEITDVRTIVVDVGCGIWLPMNPDETNKFCVRKIEFLQKKVDLLTTEELSIKAQINIVRSALQEIQGL